jgi:putative transcriptional regulator
MTKRAFDKIKAGLDSAKANLDGTADKRKYRVHIPEKIDVRRIRTRLGLTGSDCPRRPSPRLMASRSPPCATGSRAADGPNEAHASC